MIIDFHTHCFSDKVVERAMGNLRAESLYPAHFDGSLGGLKQSMKQAGIDISVILNIATNPKQTPHVNDWAIEANKEDGIISFGSLHPYYPDWKAELERLKRNGVKGIKFHPDYQGFFVDDRAAYPLYEAIAENGMTMIFHCGHDLVLRDVYRCPPQMFVKVANDFKDAKIVGAHLGGQDMWDEVFEYIVGCPAYVDTSFGFKFLSKEQIARFIDGHGEDKILFGTDTPWQCQKVEVDEMRSFVKDENVLEKIFHKNAERLLDL